MRASDRLLAALRERADRRKRLPIDVVWDAFRGAVRGFTGDAEARPQLAGLLRELEQAGALCQPKTTRRWDHSIAPPLPLWIELAGPCDDRAASSRDHRGIAWPAEMAFVTELRAVASLDELLAIREFLAHGGAARPFVPVRERSVELFGDEKRLDAIIKGSLFRPDRLSLDLLRCREVAPPLTFEVASDGVSAAALILENLHTYDSFRRYNRAARAYRAIAYGHGSEFHATVADVPRLRDQHGIDEVEYFGDLDERGLAIAVAADRWLATRGMRLEPAARWYHDLLDRAEAARLGGPTVELEPRLLAWLPQDLRRRARALLAGGHRAPQELIGWERLARLLPSACAEP